MRRIPTVRTRFDRKFSLILADQPRKCFFFGCALSLASNSGLFHSDSLLHSCDPLFLARPVLRSEPSLSWASTAKSPSMSPVLAFNNLLYETSNTEARHWSRDLNQFFERLLTIREIHDALKEMPWSSSVEERVKNMNVVFSVDIVTQVLRSGIPPRTCMCLFNWLKDDQAFGHNFYTYDVMIGVLRDSGHINEMSFLIEEYRLSKLGQDPVYFHNLIRWYGKANNLEGALREWNQMQEFQINRGIGLYNIMIDLLAKHKRYHEAVLIYYQMIHAGCAVNRCTYTILIKHLAKLSKTDAAHEVFRKLPLIKVRQTAFMFAILISAYASACNQDQVKRLCLEIRDRGIKPTRQVLFFLQALVKSGKSLEADSVVRGFWPKLSLEERTSKVSYLQMTEFFECDEDEGSDVHGEHEYSAAVHSLNSCKAKAGCDSCINVHALAYALKQWNSKTVSCLEVARVDWTSQLVFEVLWHMRRAEVAWKFYNWVQHRPDFKLTAPILSRMIILLATNRNIPALEQVLSLAKQQGVHLSVNILTTAIRAYGMMRNSDGAMEMFDRIAEFGSEPNVEAYANVIHALVKQGRCLKAKEYFEQMQQSGLRPSSKIYVMLIECFGLAGSLDVACSIFGLFLGTGLEHDVDVYTAVIKAYFWNQKPDMALKVFEDCRAAGIEPSDDLVVTISKGLRVLNRRKEADILQREHSEKNSMSKLWHHSENLMLIYDLLHKNLVEKESFLHLISGG